MGPLYTPAELEEARAYHAPTYVAAAVDLLLWPLVLVVAVRFFTAPLYRLASRWAAPVRSRVMERVWNGPGWSTTWLFTLLLFGVFSALSLPVDVWFGFVHEQRFGMSTQSLGSFLWDALKGQLMLVVAASALALGLFGIARKTKHWWWLVGLAAALVLVVSTALDPYRARLYVDQAPLPAGALRTRLTEMLERAQVPFSDILVVKTGVKTVRVQAAFAGTGPTRTILLTDTLLAKMSDDQIVAAVAHEAGHVSESRWVGRVLSPLALFALLGFIEWLFRRSAARGWFGITERADVRVLPIVLLVFDLAVGFVTPFSAAVSRERESAADRYAVTLTSSPEALASLLIELGRINKIDPDPPRWYVLAGVTHPTVPERVAAIQKNATPPPTTPVTDGTSEQQAPGVTR